MRKFGWFSAGAGFYDIYRFAADENRRFGEPVRRIMTPRPLSRNNNILCNRYNHHHYPQMLVYDENAANSVTSLQFCPSEQKPKKNIRLSDVNHPLSLSAQRLPPEGIFCVARTNFYGWCYSLLSHLKKAPPIGVHLLTLAVVPSGDTFVEAIIGAAVIVILLM